MGLFGIEKTYTLQLKKINVTCTEKKSVFFWRRERHAMHGMPVCHAFLL